MIINMKNKLIFLSFITVLLVFSNFLTSYSQSYLEFQDTLLRSFSFETGYNPSYTANFTLQDNNFSVEGKFFPDTVSKIYFDELGFYIPVTSDKNGNFTASCVLPKNDKILFTSVIIYTSSEGFYKYRIEYDPVQKEWFFGDNGYSALTEKFINNPLIIPSEVTMMYITASGEFQKASETFEKVKELAEEITADCYTDYEKGLAISKYISSEIYYDSDARESSDPGAVDIETVSLEYVLENKRTICIGFSNLFAAMCDAVGINAYVIEGSVTGEEVTYQNLGEKMRLHNWNVFYASELSRFVIVDTVWDGGNVYQNGKYKKNSNREPRFRYFDTSLLALSFDHRPTKIEYRNYSSAILAFEFSETESTLDTSGISSQTIYSKTDRISDSITYLEKDIEYILPLSPIFYITIVSIIFLILITVIIIIAKRKNNNK